MSDTIVTYIVSDISPSEVYIWAIQDLPLEVRCQVLHTVHTCLWRYHYQTVWAIPTSGGEMYDTVYGLYLPLDVHCQTLHIYGPYLPLEVRCQLLYTGHTYLSK